MMGRPARRRAVPLGEVLGEVVPPSVPTGVTKAATSDASTVVVRGRPAKELLVPGLERLSAAC